MYTLTKYTKEAMFPHTGTWTLNEFILAAGDATSDNLPPRWSQIQYSWRAPTLEIQQQIYQVLENNAKQAAGATGCRAHVQWVTKTRPGLANNALADLTYRNMELVGAPTYAEEAKEFGREIQRTLGLEPMADPFPEAFEELISPGSTRRPPASFAGVAEELHLRRLHRLHLARADGARLHRAPVLRTPHRGFEYPAWAYNAMGGRPEIVDPGMFLAGKTIAGTVLDLLTVDGELEKARPSSTSAPAAVGGDQWMAPLLPRDFQPPIDLRWPEYVTTERGEEWWIPTPARRQRAHRLTGEESRSRVGREAHGNGDSAVGPGARMTTVKDYAATHSGWRRAAMI